MRTKVARHGLLALLLAGCGTPIDTGVSQTETQQSAVTGAARAPGKTARKPRGHKDPDARRHATGYRESTAEERQRPGARPEVLTEVRPTPLALDRVRRHLSRRGTAPGAQLEAQVVPTGADLATAPAAAATTTLGQPAAAAETVATAAITGDSLPRAVDNSALPAFPEIRSQGGIGSCVAFAIGYYQYTHELGLLAGWNNHNGNDDTKVSPKWVYNLISGGYNGGTGDDTVYGVLMQHGALTWAEFPYDGDASNPINYSEWPRGASTWRSAMKYKAASWSRLPAPTGSAEMEQVKNVLLNGHVLTFATTIYDWVFDQVDDDPATPGTDPHAGEQIATWVDGSDGPHEMTIVGYDDDIWVDINGDGVVDAGEKGAFKVANSWGQDWQNAGFAWLAYDSLYWTSQVPGGPASWTRRPPFWSLTAVTARTNYQPNLVAELTLTAVRRSDVRMTVGVTEPDRKNVAFLPWTPQAFIFGGICGFDGTDQGNIQSASFALDFSDLALSNGDVRYQIALENGGLHSVGLSSLTLVDNLRSGLRTVSTEAPVWVAPSAPGQAQGVRYTFKDPARVPRLTVASSSSLAFGNVEACGTSDRTVTLQNSGTGDLLITSMRPTNALYSSPTVMPVRIRPGASTTVGVRFAPASSESESGTMAIRNTSSNLPSASLSLTGTGTSNNAAAPLLVYLTAQNDAADNSIAMRIQLKNQSSQPIRVSDDRVMYFFKEPGINLANLVWDTYYTSGPAVTVQPRRLFVARQAGIRTADAALELTFPEGTMLAPGSSIIFQGALRAADYSWYPNENDDWSRYTRRDGLAETTIVQDIQSQAVVFGCTANAPAGAMQLTLTPTPVENGSEMTTFVVNDPSWLNQIVALDVMRPDGTIPLGPSWSTYINALGPQTVWMGFQYLTPGEYVMVLKKDGVAYDYVAFTKL